MITLDSGKPCITLTKVCRLLSLILESLSGNETFLKIPIIRQRTNYSCGAASLLAVLRFFNAYKGNEVGLYGKLRISKEDGTSPDSIVRVAKQYGLQAKVKENLSIYDLHKLLDKKIAVILDIQAWKTRQNKSYARDYRDGHYVVLIGIQKGMVYLMDPSLDRRYGYLPIGQLMDRWHDQESTKKYMRTGILISNDRKKQL